MTALASVSLRLPALVTEITRRAAVSRRGLPLREAIPLELVDRHDHRGLVEPDHVGELLLRVLAVEGGAQNVIPAPGQAEGSQSGGHLAGECPMRSIQEPAEVSLEALALLGVGCTLFRLHGHAWDGSAIGSPQNNLLWN